MNQIWIKTGLLTLVMLPLHILFPSSSISQQAKIDSLSLVLQRAKPDTNKVNTLVALCYQLFSRDPKMAAEYAGQALILAGQLRSQRVLGRAYIAQGWILSDQRQYSEAEEHLKQGLKLTEEKILN